MVKEGISVSVTRADGNQPWRGITKKENKSNGENAHLSSVRIQGRLFRIQLDGLSIKLNSFRPVVGLECLVSLILQLGCLRLGVCHLD